MSDYERNKGTLIPVSNLDRVAAHILTRLEDQGWVFDEDDTSLNIIKDYGPDFGYEIIGDKVFTVEWEIQRGEQIDEFCNVMLHFDGSISFETQHYNGGGHWTELLEGKV